MENKTILSLDLGTTMGWAVLINDKMDSGSVSFARYKGCKSKSADHKGLPYLSLYAWLGLRCHIYRVKTIVYEDVFRWSSSDAAKVYGGYRGIVMSTAARYDIEVIGYSPSAIKKFWTGKGNADKNQMVKVTKQKYPNLEVKDDNQSDAIALLQLHINKNDRFSTGPIILSNRIG